MNRNEKVAWFVLITLCVTLCLFFILLLTHSAQRAVPSLSLFTIVGISPFLFRKTDINDERDKAIARHAVLIAHGFFWITFIITCFGLWYWAGSHHMEVLTIKIRYLPILPIIGMIIIFGIQSMVTIIQYRLGK